MGVAQICPVCGGYGKVPGGYEEFKNWDKLKAPVNEQLCHGCSGKGWVEVSSNWWYPYSGESWYPYHISWNFNIGETSSEVKE